MADVTLRDVLRQLHDLHQSRKTCFVEPGEPDGPERTFYVQFHDTLLRHRADTRTAEEFKEALLKHWQAGLGLSRETVEEACKILDGVGFWKRYGVMRKAQSRQPSQRVKDCVGMLCSGQKRTAHRHLIYDALIRPWQRCQQLCPASMGGAIQLFEKMYVPDKALMCQLHECNFFRKHLWRAAGNSGFASRDIVAKFVQECLQSG
jgi:hypothetical protein